VQKVALAQTAKRWPEAAPVGAAEEMGQVWHPVSMVEDGEGHQQHQYQEQLQRRYSSTASASASSVKDDPASGYAPSYRRPSTVERQRDSQRDTMPEGHDEETEEGSVRGLDARQQQTGPLGSRRLSLPPGIEHTNTQQQRNRRGSIAPTHHTGSVVGAHSSSPAPTQALTAAASPPRRRRAPRPLTLAPLPPPPPPPSMPLPHTPSPAMHTTYYPSHAGIALVSTLHRPRDRYWAPMQPPATERTHSHPHTHAHAKEAPFPTQAYLPHIPQPTSTPRDITALDHNLSSTRPLPPSSSHRPRIPPSLAPHTARALLRSPPRAQAPHSRVKAAPTPSHPLDTHRTPSSAFNPLLASSPYPTLHSATGSLATADTDYSADRSPEHSMHAADVTVDVPVMPAAMPPLPLVLQPVKATVVRPVKATVESEGGTVSDAASVIDAQEDDVVDGSSDGLAVHSFDVGACASAGAQVAPNVPNEVTSSASASASATIPVSRPPRRLLRPSAEAGDLANSSTNTTVAASATTASTTLPRTIPPTFRILTRKIQISRKS
jgi:hypothetical protein